MLQEIDVKRKKVSGSIKQETKSQFGQFFTPIHIAEFMASLFDQVPEEITLLDPGAGVGSLSSAFVANVLKNDFQHIKSIKATTYEIDSRLIEPLKSTLDSLGSHLSKHNIAFEQNVFNEDFILQLCESNSSLFTHAILNPPYKKIASDSNHRVCLREIGIEIVNLYAGFVAAALHLLKPGGELVAIIPRSFCNGSYFLPFRKYLLENSSISKIHLFNSRREAFNDDEVLQENVIIHLIKGAKQENVVVSKSTDTTFDDHSKVDIPFDRIVKADDKNLYFHIPEIDKSEIELLDKIKYSLKDLNIEVSTGPVVDFRLKEFLKTDLSSDSVALIYSNHFAAKEIVHPVVSKKPNAIVINSETKKWLSPVGFYTIIKRFSSKEEKQRIVARVLAPELFHTEYIGLENHLNYFHRKKLPIEKTLAYGLAAYLNASMIDNYFRVFSGHTQVNATDLKQLSYPNLELLNRLGEWAIMQPDFNPVEIDAKLRDLINED